MAIQTLTFIIVGLAFIIIGTYDKKNSGVEFFGIGFIVASLFFPLVIKIIEVQFP